MATFFRGFVLFLLGAIVGAGSILFFTPSFNVVVSRSGSAPNPIKVAAAPAPVVVRVAPTVTKATSPMFTPDPTPVAAAPAAAEPAIDFKSISEHLILWPTAVSVKIASTVPVMVDGKRVQDLALDVGTVLQVSKVLADGSIEVRAKGAKFEIKSALTDFSVELGKRVSELVAKGVKVDSPFAAGTVAMTPVAPADLTSTPIAPVMATVVPKGPLTLAQRVEILFGNKPEELIPSATVPAATPAPAAPVAATPVPATTAPAAPIVEAAPAVTAEPKAAEKGKDLDRKMNQLFK